VSPAGIAFLFPGQGPQAPAMLDEARRQEGFAERYACLCDVVGEDVAAGVARHGQVYLDRNEIASTVTVLCSVLELERIARSGRACLGAAGYSVGQWTAMHAAGMLDFETTLRLVFRRAQLMNASPAAVDGAMLAVIGLPNERVEEVCAEVRAEGGFVAVSNYNCLGQLSVAGTVAGVARAEELLAAAAPRKLARVGVAGAWHCALLEPARQAFRKFLESIELSLPAFPVADNVSGDLLPADPTLLREALAAHLSSPVRWEACVRRLLAIGAGELIEVGFGDMLTKFGFFIDRRCRSLSSRAL
jgi:[acyl-carrier-protein] S-malonyltransferase